MSPAPTVTAANCPREPIALDATIAYACADETIKCIDASACFYGYAVAIASFFAICAQACHTGILPRAARNAAAHGLYTIAVKTPRARVTADDRALATAQAWGLAS